MTLLPERGPAQDFSWETLAGSSGGSGQNDGAGPEARFYSPGGAVADPAGNLYIADSGNHTIRRISPEGVTSTIAGAAGLAGTADGPGLQARFNFPRSIARDRAGNLLIADSGNHTVRRISPAGEVTTLAGKAGVSGSADGPLADARFYGLRGIALAEDGTMYLSDSFNQTIRRISTEGVVSTLAGTAGLSGKADGLGAAARFLSPRGLTVMPDGAVCVADGANHTLRRITPEGAVSTLAGMAGVIGFADGKGAEAGFYQPNGVVSDAAGNLFVMDTYNCLLRKVSPDGTVSTLAGSRGQRGTADGTGSAARFGAAFGIALGPDGRLIVLDSTSDTIREVTPGGVVSTLAGAPPLPGSRDGSGLAAEFNLPSAIALAPDGSLAVADEGNHTIRTLTSQGAVGTLTGQAGISGAFNGTLAEATFNAPRGLAFDSRKTLYIADDGNKMIRRISPEGVVDTLAGMPGAHGTATRILNAFGVAVDQEDRLYFADFLGLRKVNGKESMKTLAGRRRLFVTLPDGTEAGLIWDANFTENGDGTGDEAYVIPQGLACDAQGNIYFCDGLNTIRRSTPGGTVVTIAGKAEESGAVDGTGTGARFSAPSGLALAADGTLYVADSGNHLIRRVSTTGVVTTIGGIPGYAGTGEGHGRRAQFSNPTGLVIDATGTLLVADRDNHRIVRGAQARGPHLVVESSLVHLSMNADTALPTMTPPDVPNLPTVLRLHNTGNYPLRLDSISLETGEADGVFTLTSNPEGSFLKADATVSFTLGFNPRQLRHYQCTLVIRSNDATQPVYRTRLTGTGNTVPVFPGYMVSARAGQPLEVPIKDILAQVSDPDGQELTLTLDKPESSFSRPVRLDEGNLHYYTADQGIFVDHIHVTITDSLGGAVSGQVLVFVNPVREPDRGSVVLQPLADGGISLTYPGMKWQNYVIQRSTDLRSWSDITTVMASDTGLLEWTDPDPPAGQGFYRLVIR